MKLLIVDDEELTRIGVISSVDWESLGITTILQADDGMNGLEMARLHKPEIILCDVRMPRMTGIAMLEQLEHILPDTVAIFMSGYSDKEYLKAAIKLKAINYIEKPLNPAEIRQAVLEAREMYLQKMRSHYGEAMQSVETASRLALALTVPSECPSEHIMNLASELSFSFDENTYFTSFIVKPEHFQELSFSVSSIHAEFLKFLKEMDLNCIHVEKRGPHLVYFVFGTFQPATEAIVFIGNYLNDLYSSVPKCHIAVGDSIKGISHAYKAYESAVILLQSSFFFPNHTLLTSEYVNSLKNFEKQLPDSLENTLTTALTSQNKAAADDLTEQLFLFFDKNCSVFQNQAKDLYYKLFLTLENARTQHQISTTLIGKEKNISDTMERCFGFHELHQVFVQSIQQYFEDAKASVQENSTIFIIKDYIAKNYMNETLSVKDISSYVFLSTSYVCTFFKNETGQTLNQYLTEYRMERAKQLLCDPRYKITEISSRVGYSDGNYFGKSFKKYSGYSPSEFREKMLK